MAVETTKALRDLIRSVSRSFSLTLFCLPKAQRDSVAITYLLARYADTLTDTGAWPTEKRLAYLEAWENAILKKFDGWEIEDSVGSYSPSDAALLLEGKSILSAYHREDFVGREASREVLKTLFQAMRWDLNTFGDQGQLEYGVSDENLFEWYTEAIAGCVGRYWVKLFELPSTLEPLAVSYGKGLQRINILRDVPEDWDRGRVYLPESFLEKYEIRSGEPWKAESWSAFVSDFCQKTRSYLKYGAQFCDSIPYFEYRLRFASMMPLLIGLETLRAIESAKDWEQRIKISREDVKRLAKKALLYTLTKKQLNRMV